MALGIRDGQHLFSAIVGTHKELEKKEKAKVKFDKAIVLCQMISGANLEGIFVGAVK